MKNLFKRELLYTLHHVVEKEKTFQKRLDKITKILASHLKVPVVSIYLLRPGEMLELFATSGLDKRSVHETFLRIGEGLVGEVALQQKLLIVEDAWAHPSFVFKPMTKEQAFKSFLGLPIMKKDLLLGVLVVQQKQVGGFTEEQIETLQLVELLLDELLSEELAKNSTQKINVLDMRRKLEGVKLIEGLAVGTVFVHQRAARVINLLSAESTKEEKKFLQACSLVQQELQKMRLSPILTAEQKDMFDFYLLLLKDKEWLDKIKDSIHSGLSAEGAVQKIGDELTERMEGLSNTYFKERVHDLGDLASRLIFQLQRRKKLTKHKLPPDTILVANSLGPAELLDYSVENIKAIVLANGSQTMHVVIVARSLNIPVIGGIDNITDLTRTGDLIAVDAIKGYVYVHPTEEILDDFHQKILKRTRRQQAYQNFLKYPSQTKDGVNVSLMANAGFATDLMYFADSCFEGVGLYRTELPFMMAEKLPDCKTQTEIYRQAYLTAAGRPIVFRTLDIGSDKILPYLGKKKEENPALGWRSIRITLDRRALLRSQLRAFIRAVDGGDLYLMFPMISDIDEFIEAKKTLQIELESEKHRGMRLPASIKVGTMLEVPSLIFQLPQLVKLVDFVSVGTNDLYQFLFAVDRGNAQIWERYDSLSPAFLSTLKYISDTCKAANVSCSVCGEMAGKPLEAMALIGLGFEKLSLNASALGAVKSVVCTMNQAQTAEYLQTQLSMPSHSLRAKLKAYAMDHGVFI